MLIIDYSYSVYSQFGEDGILQFLINELNLSNHQCCEVGMNHLIYSNTYNLLENYNWYGVLIEKNPFHLPVLEYGNIIHAEVKSSGDTLLDNILETTELDTNFDILSIDIDGNDYHIWDSLNRYTPNIIIIEINPFFNCDTEYIYDGKLFSSSFKSTVDLGTKKGYTLVCMTGNLIFVKNEILSKSSLGEYLHSNPCDLFLDDAIMISNREFSFRRYIKTPKLI